VAVTAKVNLRLDHVEAVVKEATEEVIRMAALRIVERAQLNIRDNDQIDTGFMVNSVYGVWGENSDYAQARGRAMDQTTSRKTGKTVDHGGDMAPEAALPGGKAGAVVVGASYAIYQEAADPFLWPAAEATMAEFGGEANKIYKEEVKD